MIFWIIFIAIPFTELMVFAAVSQHIGIFTTLCLAFLSAIIGGILVRKQGLKTIFAMRDALDRGKIPLNEIFDGFCLVAAGALLITPGFVTDTVGALLLIPAMRRILRTMIKKHTTWAVGAQEFQARAQNGSIIEGEYERTEE
jgi:UPF0716 protein FxsA